jgi:uncharacterized protein
MNFVELGLLTDPWFYVAATVACLIAGISKGGFGGGLGVIGVPLMALTISPVQAAGIMLPVLCAMDLFGLWAYRRTWDRANMRVLLPAALLGIGIGTLSASLLSDDAVRAIVGVVAVVFTVHYVVRGRLQLQPTQARPVVGWFWGTIAGFTSFLAHAGGPPLSVYLLPQRLEKTLFAGTTVVFFAVVNFAKLVPYAFLGQLNVSNLATAAVLMPLAPLGMWLGIRLHQSVSDKWFYRVVYVCVFLTGLKLLWDGLT